MNGIENVLAKPSTNHHNLSSAITPYLPVDEYSSAQQNPSSTNETKGIVKSLHKSQKTVNIIKSLSLTGSAANVSKNVAKGLNSTLAELIRNTVMDKSAKRPWNMSVYNTFIDSFFSRAVVDTFIGFVVNGTKKFIPPEITQAIVAAPVAGLMRAITSSRNILGQMSEDIQATDPETIKFINEVEKLPFMKLYYNLSGDFFNTKCQPVFNKILKYVFGINAPEKVKDPNGNILKDDYGHDLEYLPKINNLHFCGALAVIFGSTLFLDKTEKPSGFDDVDNLPRAVLAQVAHMLARVHSNFFSKAHLLLKGRNFDDILNDTITRKLSNPSAQYLADTVASLNPLASILGPVPTSLILRFIVECTVPFFTLGATSKNDDRIPNTYKYLDHKLVRPVINSFERASKPAFKFLFKNIYGKLPGGFYKDIPNMYDSKERSEQLNKKFRTESKYVESISSLPKYERTGLIAKDLLRLPYYLISAVKDSINLNSQYNKNIEDILSQTEQKFAII